MTGGSTMKGHGRFAKWRKQTAWMQIVEPAVRWDVVVVFRCGCLARRDRDEDGARWYPGVMCFYHGSMHV